MKSVTLYFTFLFSALLSSAQEIKTSSDCKKEGVEYYKERDFPKAESSFRSCIELAQEEKNWRTLGQCYNNLGSVQFQKGAYVLGIINYENATKVYEEHKLDTLLGESYLNLGLAYKKQNIYDSSITNYYRGIAILEELDIKVDLIKGYNMLANVLRETASKEKAKKWYLRALKISQAENDLKEVANIYNNLGTLFKKEGKPDSAIHYYKSSLTLKKEGKPKGLGNSYFNLGETFVDLHQIDSAIMYYRKSIDYRLIAKDNFGLAHSNLALAKAFIMTGELEFVIDPLQKAHRFTSTVESKDLYLKYIEIQRDYFLSIGKYIEARDLYEEINIVREEILNENKQDLITSYEIKYDVQKLQEIIISKDQALIWTFASTGMLFITGVFLYRERQKKKKAARIIETLFKDMHHRVKNNLSLLNGVITFRRRTLRDVDAKNILKSIGGQIDTINLIHQKLYLQQGKKIGNIDLSQYLQELVENVFVSSGLEASQYDLEFELKTAQISADKANPIGLIVNEVVTNTIKHGRSLDNHWHLFISLLNVKDVIEIKLRDRGEGISQEGSEGAETSSGLSLIEILCEQINAEFNFDFDNGTQFILRVRK